MPDDNSELLTSFHGRRLPVAARPAGYAWLRERYGLEVPLPPRLAAIGARHRRVESAEWLILTPRHAPAGTLAAQLEFALKWEGLNLAVLRALFGQVTADEVRTVVLVTLTGVYARRAWFVYEWLTGRELDVPPPGDARAVPVIRPAATVRYGAGPALVAAPGARQPARPAGVLSAGAAYVRAGGAAGAGTGGAGAGGDEPHAPGRARAGGGVPAAERQPRVVQHRGRAAVAGADAALGAGHRAGGVGAAHGDRA